MYDIIREFMKRLIESNTSELDSLLNNMMGRYVSILPYHFTLFKMDIRNILIVELSHE